MARLDPSRRSIAAIRRAWALMWLGLAPCSLAHADVTTYVASGSPWRHFPGTAEPSADPSAWRAGGFDDSQWAEAPAPFGYGLASPPATDLSRREPPMRGSYTTLYLRASFELTDPAGVVELHARADHDDGFILWINGVEVARSNAPEGDAPPFDSIATRSRSPGTFELFDELPNPQTFLVAGRNWVAVQAFNVSKANNDFKIDLELLDPFGPDLSPPRVLDIVPSPGAAVKRLGRVEVAFSEDVRGVDAGDLLIGGAPAAAVTRLGRGPFVFTFDARPDGVAELRWAADHGITDVAPRQNPFGGGSWTNRVDSTAPEADVVLGEISATGSAGFADEDGDESDWIEVHNRGITHVRLLGWSLSDDPENPGQWTFPDVELAPGERLIVFASGKDRRDPAGELHASFSLAAGGEYLGLFRAESPRGAAAELSPRYPEQRFGHSYGPAGGERDGKLGYLSPPTPGLANGAAASLAGFAVEPVLSVERGIHTRPFELAMASRTAGATLRYTLDGGEPTADTGEVYTGPMTIDGTPERAVVTVRAAAFRDGHLPSRTVTGTYIFAAHVPAQPRSPPGFPTTWGAQIADYGMDPAVAAQAGDRAMAGLMSLPHVSIVASTDDLFGRQRGIYANAALSGPAWERPISVEAIFPDGRRGFQADCGLRIQGGSSTAEWKSIKLSMRLVFRGDYGQKKLEARVFEDSPVDRFDSLVLDAHLNLAYTHPDHAQRVRSQFVRDIYVADLQRATGSPAPHGRFVHLYLNGLYWGMYDLHERPDASFAAEHLGGDKSEYDVVRHNATTLVDGNLQAWNETFRRARLNLQSPDNYLALAEYLDLAGLADYMLVNLYAGNTDWAHHNWYAGRRRLPGEKLRFFSWDAEHVLKSTAEAVLAVNNAGAPTELFTRLRAVPEFRQLFADRVERHLAPGGPFHVDAGSPEWDPEAPGRNRPAELYMRRIAEVDTAVILESARWGDSRRPGLPYTRDNEFQAELDLLLRSYFPQRTRVVRTQLAAAGLAPRLPAPVYSLAGGAVESGAELAVNLPAGVSGKIYLTTDGSDPRVPFTAEVSPQAIEPAGPLIIRDAVRVKARVLDDGGWGALGEAAFTIAGPRDGLRIVEIHYHPAPLGGSPDAGDGPEFIEILNVAGSTVDLTGLVFSRGIEHAFAPGATLAAGARLVLTSSIAAFQARYPGVHAHGEFRGSLANGGEAIAVVDAAGEEVLAVEYDDEGEWPQGPDGFGWSLVIAAPELDPHQPASWRASAVEGGAPGLADAAAPWGVAINEALANTSPPHEDAIEIANLTGRAIDVSHWYLSDDRGGAEGLKKHRLPPGSVVPAHGFLVIFEAEFNPAFDAPGAFGLSAGGDDVYLASADPGGRLTGHITGHSFSTTASGVAMGRIETAEGAEFTALAAPTLGADSPSTLEEFRAGTGAPNAGALPAPVVINEIHYHPVTGFEFIELHNPGGAGVELGGERGRWRVSGILDEAGIGDFELPPGASIPARGFLLLSPVEPAAFRAAHNLSPGAAVLGPYRGSLDNAGERLSLLRPIDDDGELVHVVADSVRYGTVAPWPEDAGGGGPSLERIAAAAFAGDAGSWRASAAEGGSPGAANSRAEPGEPVPPQAAFSVVAGVHGPLEVVLDAQGSLDPDGVIAVYRWELGGGATASGRAASHTFAAAGRYLVRLTVTDDSGLSAQAVRIIAVPAVGAGGAQVPGDANQDARLDLSDAVTILRQLFFGDARAAPCGGESWSDGGSLTLLDADASGGVNLTDVIHTLNFLYRGGPQPALGVSCVRVPGCPEVCRS